MSKVTVVIPSFNGLEILKKSLPAVRRHSLGAKIIVVDDGGSDGTREWLAAEFPAVTVLVNETNLGFPKSINRGVLAAETEYVALLNNDVYPQKSYLKAALKYFSDSELFAVTFNEAHSSWPVTSWQNGKLHYSQAEDKSRAVYSTWASGGSCLFRRELWQALDGFNPVYSPGYWEDIDLGWRSWKAGYKIVWAPDAKVIHRHESTFKRLDQNWLNQVKQRNELLFTWQNISDPGLVVSHLAFLLRHTLTHPGYLRVVLAALGKIGEARSNPKAVRTDREILGLVGKAVEHG